MDEQDWDRLFSERLREVLAEDHRGEASRLAHHLGLNEHNFRARLAGRVRFTLNEIKALLHHIPDLRLAHCLLEGTEFEARPIQAAGQPGDLLTGAMDATQEASDVMEEVRQALQDQSISHLDRRNIERELVRAEMALATVRRGLEQTGA